MKGEAEDGRREGNCPRRDSEKSHAMDAGVDDAHPKQAVPQITAPPPHCTLAVRAQLSHGRQDCCACDLRQAS
jgi:hypothetical protein